MSQIPVTDQWKLDGDCSQCRRKDYCKKFCSKTMKRLQVFANEYFKSLKGKEEESDATSETENDEDFIDNKDS